MAQRYAAPTAHSNMKDGLCPECGLAVDEHSPDTRFWIPRRCDLTVDGVRDRIAQYEADLRKPVA